MHAIQPTRPIWRFPFLLVVVVATGGCSNMFRSFDSMGAWNADPLVIGAHLQVDPISLLSDGAMKFVPPPKDGSGESFDQQLQKATASFMASTSPLNYAQRRDLLQDRLMLTAFRLCEDYKMNLSRKQARGNFWLGTTSLFLGTAGALTTHASAARALAGGSGFASGVRSEYNQDYFFDKTVDIIAKAISKKQEELRRAIVENRVKSGPDTYNVMQALVDVSRLHAACSLSGAIEFMDKAMESYDLTKGASLSRQIRSDWAQESSSGAAPVAPEVGAASAPGKTR